MPNITANKLSFSYKNGHRSVQALHDLELNVRDGEFVCIIGPSGCGKSTLLRILAGLEKPDSGSVIGVSERSMIVFQDYALFPWMTAKKNVSFALHHSGFDRKKAEAEAERYMSLVGMENAAELYPCELSGGMKQRVSIARALAMDTDLLLLDEPFGALDAKIRKELQDLLLELWSRAEKKKTVIFVTHDITEAAMLADRVLFMDGGTVTAEIEIEKERPRCKACTEKYRAELYKLFDGRQEGELNE